MFADAATIGLLFFLGFIGLGIALISTLRFWLVEGTLDSGPAILVLGVLLIGSATVIKSTSPLLMLLWVTLLIGGGLVFPVLSSSLDRRALNKMFEEDVTKYRRALQRDPGNAAAWREMAEAYMKMNRYDDAIAAYKEAIKLNPHDVQRLRSRLNAALDYHSGMRRTTTVICDACKEETAKGLACRHCGVRLEMNPLERLFHAKNLRQVLQTATVFIAGGVAAFTVFTTWPMEVKALVILSCLAVGGSILWRAIAED